MSTIPAQTALDPDRPQSHEDLPPRAEIAPPPDPVVPDDGGGQAPARLPIAAYIPAGRLSRWYDAIEAFVSTLSVRDNFWHRICSLIWLPYAFFSGIKMKAIAPDIYAAVLPFRRFNRNWYRAMAGGALLANSEIAGGMYVFGICGGGYTVVCKHLEYTFLRPCFGPAVYKMTTRENVHSLLKTGQEFNVTMDLEIMQQVSTPGERDKRVGRCQATFHVTPKIQHKLRKARRKMQANGK
jgi:hypothetical protein